MSEPVEIAPADVLGSLNDVEAKYAPNALYCLGDLELLRRGPRISIVGSRRASEEGLRRAALLAKKLAERGYIVVSGLAEGIDTAAHTGAMQARGRTIAVIGTPLDEAYPRSNEELQARIGAEHLLVSQFAIGMPVTPKNFPIRNRTMALLTDATVIVEAGEGSGTLHQGWEALRLGRLLFLMESVANDTSLKWPGEMMHYGAQVLSRTNVDTCLDEIPAVTLRHDDALVSFA